MTKILVVGCSYSKGHGLKYEKNDSALWVNQLCQRVFDCPTIDNRSKSGANNHWIFLEACSAIAQNNYDLVIVSWTNVNRLNANLGLEPYSTLTQFMNQSVNIHPSQTITGNWLKETGDRIRRYQNDHWGLLDLVKYVNTLYHLQVVGKQSKLIFVNGLVSLSSNYFNQQTFSKPVELDLFVQDILQSSTRDDTEVELLYNNIHQQYQEYGGIRSEHWLNLYSSLKDMQVDTISETDPHPGYKSQNVYVEEFVPILKKKYNATMYNRN